MHICNTHINNGVMRGERLGDKAQYYVPFKYGKLVHSTHAGPLYWLIYIPCTK